MTEEQRDSLRGDLVTFMVRFARRPDDSVPRAQAQPYYDYLNNIRSFVRQVGGNNGLLARINGAQTLLDRKTKCEGIRILGVCSEVGPRR